MTALTDERFWDGYWSTVQLPARIDPRVQWQLALSRKLKQVLTDGAGKRLFEVGCAPGRWLIWFNRELGYRVAGCDISPHGLALTRRNLELNGMTGDLLQLDLLRDPLPPNAYDVVVSLGVVEHFESPEAIVEKHVTLLCPGGRLVLEMPNFAGSFNHWLVNLCGLQELLRVHNLAVMRAEFFSEIAARFNLRLDYLGYIGGFDPGLVVFNLAPQPWPSRLARAAWLALRMFNVLYRRFPAIAIRFNSPRFSHMLLGVFTKL